ncbi:unnamed protein product, partial [Phaeothamnion confervicola]
FWTFDRPRAEAAAARRRTTSPPALAAATAAAAAAQAGVGAMLSFNGADNGALHGQLGVFGQKVEQPRWLLSAVFLPGSRLALTGADNGAVYVWRGARCVGAVARAHAGPVCALAVEDGGTWWASGGGDGLVHRWEGVGPVPLETLTAPREIVGDSGGGGSRELGLTAHAEAKPTLFAKRARLATTAAAAFKTSTAPAWKSAPLLRNSGTAAAKLSANVGGDGITTAAGLPTGERNCSDGGGECGNSSTAVVDVAVGPNGVIFVGTGRASIYALPSEALADATARRNRTRGGHRGGGGSGGGRGAIFDSSDADAGAGPTGGAMVPVALAQGHSAPVHGLAVHPFDPHVLYTAGEDRVLSAWDTRRRGRTAAAALPAPARSVAVSPCGRHVAVGLRGGAVVVLLAAPQLNQVIAQWRHCREDIDDLKYSPDGSRLAVASHDNFVDIYDVTPPGAAAGNVGAAAAGLPTGVMAG